MQSKTSKMLKKHQDSAHTVRVNGQDWTWEVQSHKSILIHTPTGKRVNINSAELRTDKNWWEIPTSERIIQYIEQHPNLALKKHRGMRTLRIGQQIWQWIVSKKYKNNVVTIIAPTGKKTQVEGLGKHEGKIICDNCYFGVDYENLQDYFDHDLCNCKEDPNSSFRVMPGDIRYYIECNKKSLMTA